VKSGLSRVVEVFANDVREETTYSMMLLPLVAPAVSKSELLGGLAGYCIRLALGVIKQIIRQFGVKGPSFMIPCFLFWCDFARPQEPFNLSESPA
jgi:hypothetical protein